MKQKSPKAKKTFYIDTKTLIDTVKKNHKKRKSKNLEMIFKMFPEKSMMQRKPSVKQILLVKARKVLIQYRILIFDNNDLSFNVIITDKTVR